MSLKVRFQSLLQANLFKVKAKILFENSKLQLIKIDKLFKKMKEKDKIS